MRLQIENGTRVSPFDEKTQPKSSATDIRNAAEQVVNDCVKEI